MVFFFLLCGFGQEIGTRYVAGATLVKLFFLSEPISTFSRVNRKLGRLAGTLALGLSGVGGS